MPAGIDAVGQDLTTKSFMISPRWYHLFAVAMIFNILPLSIQWLIAYGTVPGTLYLLLVASVHWLLWGVVGEHVIRRLSSGLQEVTDEESSFVQQVAHVRKSNFLLAILRSNAIVTILFCLFHFAVVPEEYGGYTMANLGVSALRQFGANMIYGAAFAMFGVAAGYFLRLRRKEEAALLLQRNLLASQMQALSMQLNPHFLFNTLHSVASLVRKSNKKLAIELIGRLSDLLRSSLDRTANPKVPLEQELEMIRLFLGIEQQRFSNRLHCSFDIADDAASAMIPNLILQPIIENALKHGIGPRTGRGEIQVGARVREKILELWVLNTGANLRSDWEEQSVRRVGIQNVRQRLALHYPGSHSFELSVEGKKNVVVRITIPLERQDDRAGTEAQSMTLKNTPQAQMGKSRPPVRIIEKAPRRRKRS